MTVESSFFRWAIRFGIIVLAGGFAYFGGKSVARGAQERRSLDALRLSQGTSDEKLECMGGNLKRGLILPTARLRNLEGEHLELTPLARNGLHVTYIDPSCFSCISQGKEMAELLKAQPERAGEFVIISYNRAALEQWRDYFEVDCIFLLDSTAELFSQFHLNIFPCNMIIDDSLRVRDILFNQTDVASWSERYRLVKKLDP